MLNYTTKLKRAILFLLSSSFILLSSQKTQAQVAATNFVFENEKSELFNYNAFGWGGVYSTATNFSVFFGQNNASDTSNNIVLQSFDVAGETYLPITFPNGDIYTDVVVNRVSNPQVTDMGKQTLFFQTASVSGPNDINRFFASQYTDITEAINRRIVNRGSDNIFSNLSSETVNNVERVDLIFRDGVLVLDEERVGFLINERGGNDPIKVAAITSLNGSNEVLTLGDLTDVVIADWSGTGVSIPTTVFQRNTADPFMRPSQNLNAQQIHGVYIRAVDLGINTNETIYGISIFPNDVTSADDLIGLTDVPLDTDGGGAGGLDMMGGGGFFVEESLLGVDLATTLSFSNISPSVGEEIILNVNISNNGPFTEPNALTEINIPAGYTLKGFVPGYAGNVSFTGGDIEWTLSNFGTNTSRTLQVIVEVNPTGNRLFTSEISGDLSDIIPPNNIATIQGYVGQGAIVAVDDDFSSNPIDGAVGGTAGNVLTNDSLGGQVISPPSDVVITLLNNGGLTGVTINSLGNVIVPSGATTGTYVLNYRICETTVPINCDNANITVIVDNGSCVAPDDVSIATADLTPLAACGSPTGVIEITSPLGAEYEYSIDAKDTYQSSTTFSNLARGTYTIYVRNVNTGCESAPASFIITSELCINDINLGVLSASDGGTTTETAYINDVFYGTPITDLPDLSVITTTITNDGGLTGATLNANGTLNVPPGLLPGVYFVTYEVCETADLTKCRDAIITIALADIEANDDAGGPVLGLTGANNVLNIYSNDILNAAPVAAGDVITTIISSNPNLTLNANGQVDVNPNTPAGTQTLTYRICEDANPWNCDEATVSITTTAAPIEANDDSTGIHPATGASNVANVFDNDLLNSLAVVPSDVVLSIVTPDPTGTIILNPDGSVDIAPNGAAYEVQVTYRICEVLNPTNCDEAVITAEVEGVATVETAVCNCSDDAAYLFYDVATNANPALPMEIIWFSMAGDSIYSQTTTTRSGQILFPGCEVDAQGNGINWPGWLNDGDGWYQGSDGFEDLTPQAKIIFRINPETDTTVVEYPDATPECATEPTSFFLPVTWLKFTAQQQEDVVMLKWKTAAEINNDYFEVQRSNDGIKFETIGKVQGNGNTNRIIKYNFVDKSPLKGYSYYRLKQVDFDASSEYSTVEVVSFNNEERSFKVFPNPFNDIIIIDAGEGEKLGLISINDAAGRTIREGIYNENIIKIDMHDLKSGLYFITRNNIQTQKIIKR